MYPSNTKMNSLLFFVLFSIISIYKVSATATVALSELTFDKVLSKFPVSLVKFDVAFPYGEKYETFKSFAKETNKNPDLLLVEVGIKDYGEKENEALAVKYQVVKDDYPVLKLFVQGKKDPISFPAKWDFTIDNLRKFVRDNSAVYIGLPGCLESYDGMVKKFMNGGKDKKQSVIKQAEEELKKLGENVSVPICIYFFSL